MLTSPLDNATHRLREGWVVTRGKSKIKHARISSTGKVHIIKDVIIRWNFYGGTREKPDVTFVLLCGPQTHHPQPALGFRPHDLCARCGNKEKGRTDVDSTT